MGEDGQFRTKIAASGGWGMGIQVARFQGVHAVGEHVGGDFFVKFWGVSPVGPLPTWCKVCAPYCCWSVAICSET